MSPSFRWLATGENNGIQVDYVRAKRAAPIHLDSGVRSLRRAAGMTGSLII